jgi:hypothetical protein
VTGAVVGALNEQDAQALHAALEDARRAYADAVARVRLDEGTALEELARVRTALENPGHMQGSPATKHGIVAEKLSVHGENARAFVNGAPPALSFDGVHATGPVDYYEAGRAVQSKFYQTPEQSLSAVLDHWERWGGRGFPADGVYRIPKDQFAAIEAHLRAGDAGPALRARVAGIEAATGRPFAEVVGPAPVDYASAQLDNAGDATDHLERTVRERAREKAAAEAQSRREAEAAARADAAPSWAGGARAAAYGAAAGGVIAGGATLLAHRARWMRGEITLEEYLTLSGKAALKGAFSGGVSGAGVYAITRLTPLESAPLAGAAVKALWDTAGLLMDWRAGRLTARECVDRALDAYFDTAVCTAGAMVGQALIPIPVVGPLLGTLAARAVLDLVQGGPRHAALMRELNARITAFEAAVEAQHRAAMAAITARLDSLEARLALVFSPAANAAERLAASVVLAEEAGVPKGEILRSADDALAFLNG